ncbi:UNVERIFIED_CONTAM: tRNA (guanine(37)-N1)-methyltransferase 1 [Sesamum latifolium]|uniref:tRNA (Guanine(37)-N1)-methyltransferase 1 n=1 Tax=Sesamum latifolium TaxID=2727402 RepID=A0AAW2WU33_9LAMI
MPNSNTDGTLEPLPTPNPNNGYKIFSPPPPHSPFIHILLSAALRRQAPLRSPRLFRHHHRSFLLLHSPYGPSLQKGYSPFPLEPVKHTSSGENITSLDEAAFTRVFDISALRVPSSICSTLENRLRGHLLNWPRIRNIARVSGDEIDDQLKSLLPNSGDGPEAEAEDENLVALNRRIYGKAEGDGEPLNAVLYRDKLARTFNSRGYAKFRNLAKMSRPKKKKRGMIEKK